ncbi:hypothetical protein FHG87_011295 [Trinorchestia longiramus]|nr:hypothetical protein FHG87_011295 [Trinorchestia longiramus]
MNMLVVFLVGMMTWTAQARPLPSGVPAQVLKDQQSDLRNKLSKEQHKSPTLDSTTFISAGKTGNFPSDIAAEITQHLRDEGTGYPSLSITGYSVVSETGSELDLLSRVKRARAVQRNHRHKKRRYMMGGKRRPHGKYRG